ncbi:MAG: DUF4388 domain-containing protein [Myxococcota bacterium]
MDAALHGNLQDFGIADVFQLIGHQRKTGFLELERDDQRLRIGFDDGSVLTASPVGELESAPLGELLVRSGLLSAVEFERTLDQSRVSARPLTDLWVESGVLTKADLQEMFELLTRETLFQLMAWPTGAFHFTRSPVRNGLTVGQALAVERVLMDGLRKLDEWRTFDADVRSPDRVFRRMEGSASDDAVAVPSDRAEVDALAQVLGWVDGKRSVSEIIDRSRRGTFEVTRTLSELHRSGRIEGVEPEAPRESPSPSRWISAAMRAVQLGAAVLFPLVGLALVVSLSMVQSPAGSEWGGRSLVASPLAEARMRFERRRAEHAREAESYRSRQPAPEVSGQLAGTGRVSS